MYCTSEEVRALLKDDFLSNVVADRYLDSEEERQAALLPLLQEAVSDAAAEIDGYLARRYPVPIDPVPTVIHKFCKDMAVYNLISRAGLDEQGAEKNFLTRYQSAIKFLALVAEGKVSLGMDSSTPGSVTPVSYTVKGARRVFDRSRLEGM